MTLIFSRCFRLAFHFIVFVNKIFLNTLRYIICIMTVTNNYLKSCIEDISNFFKNNTKPPEDMYLNLVLELKVSNLLMPVMFDGMNFSFPHLEVDDGTRLVPLFTSDEELKKYSTEFDYISNEIAYYVEMVMEKDMDGILIDMQSDEFCVERPLLEKIPLEERSYKKY